MSGRVETARQIQERMIQEIDAKIVKLKAEGRTKDIEKLERFKRVFLIQDSNFVEVDNHGTYRFRR